MIKNELEDMAYVYKVNADKDKYREALKEAADLLLVTGHITGLNEEFYLKKAEKLYKLLEIDNETLSWVGLLWLWQQSTARQVQNLFFKHLPHR